MQTADEPAVALASDPQGWTWRVERPGRAPLEGRADGQESARRTGRFAYEMLAAFERIGRSRF